MPWNLLKRSTLQENENKTEVYRSLFNVTKSTIVFPQSRLFFTVTLFIRQYKRWKLNHNE